MGICVGAALTIGGDLVVKLWLTRWIAAQAAAAAAHVRFWHFAGAYVVLALAQAALDSGKDLYFRVVQVRQREREPRECVCVCVCVCVCGGGEDEVDRTRRVGLTPGCHAINRESALCVRACMN